MNSNTQSVMVGAIVAMNNQRIIGVDGDLPWHYPEDLKRFKRETLNTTIIMGRLTWLSLGEKALPNRRNIVVSSQQLTEVECYTSAEDALNKAVEECLKNKSNNEEATSLIWVIGGGQMYQSMADKIDFFDVTLVPDELDESRYKRVTKLFDFDETIWQKGAWVKSPYDERIKHQRIVRRNLNQTNR